MTMTRKLWNIGLGALFALLLSSAALGMTACRSAAAEATPEHAVAAAVNAVRSFDCGAMADLWGDAMAADPADALAKRICAGVAYEIVSAETDGDEAQVTVILSNTDMGAVTTDLMAALAPRLASPSARSLSDDELSALSDRQLRELLLREGNDRVRRQVCLSLRREDGRWVLCGDNAAAVRAMLGGLSSLDSVRGRLGEQLAALRADLRSAN